MRYADGRSAMLSAQDDGVQMALDGDNGASCRSWYPAGHVFSEADKKAALNAYASRLGLPVAASDTGGGCSSTTASAPESARAIRQARVRQARGVKATGPYRKGVRTASATTRAADRVGEAIDSARDRRRRAGPVRAARQ